MLYELLLFLFVFVAILLILIIMIQQSKGSMGLGSFGGQAQMLFGGSGGQDIFQKITWTLGAIFMLGSFGLTLMKHHQAQTSRYLANHNVAIHKKANLEHIPQQTEAQEVPAQSPEASDSESK
ncbi:MAG TPA: preprotein translocase subunit SecG [Candidatus Limnocylindria bacterium]|nr:preprotein translocase subunit SecG [Candidatus Limnocylindria bacterium]